MKSRILALAALSTVAFVPAALGRPLTTAPDVFVDITVKLTDSRISVNPHGANRGDEARFIIRNTGTKPHAFTLGSTQRGLGVQTGFSRTLKPREQKILLLFLNYRGELKYYSKLKHDLGKPGMTGIFRIR